MSTSRPPIGIELITALGMAPVAYVEAAAALGCNAVSVALTPFVKLTRFPDWSLHDAALRREMKAAMQDHGMSVSLGEGVMALPGKDIRDAAGALDIFAELGAQRVNILPADPDHSRLAEQCALFADFAAERRMDAVMEFMPILPVGTLPDAISVVAAVAKPNFRVLLDAMHVFRSGASAADVAALDPNRIGYVQLCDVPLKDAANYAEEARCERLPPGQGELPLADFVKALPPEVFIGVEIPMSARGESGEDPKFLMKESIDAARALLARCEEGG